MGRARKRGRRGAQPPKAQGAALSAGGAAASGAMASGQAAARGVPRSAAVTASGPGPSTSATAAPSTAGPAGPAGPATRASRKRKAYDMAADTEAHAPPQAPASASGAPASGPASDVASVTPPAAPSDHPTPASTLAPAEAAPPPSAHPGRDPLEPTAECLVCFDRLPPGDLICAGADGPTSSNAAAGCGHLLCEGCMREYVRGAVRDRKFPVCCPMATGASGGGGCRTEVSVQQVEGLLWEDPQELQAYGIMAAEATIAPGRKLYCPHSSCSTPMQRPDDGEELPPDQPVNCPACSRMFCPRCLIPGWHQGYSCAQFQALPPHQRSAEDAAMLSFAAGRQWKQCPACRLVVERSEGCNYIRCRCGKDFCYACGKVYLSSAPTAANVHGTPGCGCRL